MSETFDHTVKSSRLAFGKIQFLINAAFQIFRHSTTNKPEKKRKKKKMGQKECQKQNPTENCVVNFTFKTKNSGTEKNKRKKPQKIKENADNN